jgi:tRNA-Thr(GGU) m(6)t(6)A37 methyltransferase TsaA
MATDKIEMKPIGIVCSDRLEPIDDQWDSVKSVIEMNPDIFGTDALIGLSDFSHCEVIYFFHKVNPEKIEHSARHPRGNKDWPKVGIFAQRAKDRPNRIGSTICKILSIDGMKITVIGLDAIEGTPVLDIKPYLAEFGPRGAIRQPQWSNELMRNYW